MNRFEWKEGEFEPAEEEVPAQSSWHWRFTAVISFLLICSSVMALWWLQSDARKIREQVQMTETAAKDSKKTRARPNSGSGAIDAIPRQSGDS